MNKTYTKEVAIIGALGLALISMQSNTGDSMQINAEEIPKVEEETYYVIDASYIDHSGKYEDCIEYAELYKDHHEYIVVTSKDRDLARDLPE